MWLLNAPSSPIYNWSLYHVGPKNALVSLLLPAVIVGALISGNVHQPSEVGMYAAVFAFWLAIGYAFALLLFPRAAPDHTPIKRA